MIFEIADRLRRDDDLDVVSLGHMYVAAIGADLQWYQPATQSLIQGSTILLRSLTYHRVIRTPGVVESLERFLPVHPRFTVSVVLTASLDSRRQRLQMRRERSPGEVAPDDLMVELDPGKFFAMERELIAIVTEHFEAEVIDTSELSEAEVTRRILDLGCLIEVVVGSQSN